jgi:hypothetical protein
MLWTSRPAEDAEVPARWIWWAGLACTVLWAVRWPAFPPLLDPAYHLAIAQQVRAAGGVLAQDVWQWAPVGRPHLYPPALHLAMAGGLAIGLPPVALLRLLSVAAPLAVLVSLVGVAHRLLDSRQALGTLLIALAPFGW